MLTLACAAVILTRLPLEDLGAARFAGVLSALRGRSSALLAAALQVAAATHARTFKEGQTYLSMLLFLPMFIGMFSAFSHAPPAPWHLAVPVLGQQLLLAAVLRGDVPGPLTLALPALVALVITALLLRRIAFLLSSDRILYG